MLSGEHNETDVSGSCDVLYETISADVFRKIKVQRIHKLYWLLKFIGCFFIICGSDKSINFINRVILHHTSRVTLTVCELSRDAVWETRRLE